MLHSCAVLPLKFQFVNLNNFCFSDVENFDNIDRVTNNTPMDVSSTYSDETLIYGYDCDSEGNTFDDDDDISSGSDEISSGSSNISRSGSSTDIYEDECYNPLTYIHEGLTFLYTNADNLIMLVGWLVGWFCCFTSQVNSYGHCGTVSSPNHTFSWAGLNKRFTSNLCTYFRL